MNQPNRIHCTARRATPATGQRYDLDPDHDENLLLYMICMRSRQNLPAVIEPGTERATERRRAEAEEEAANERTANFLRGLLLLLFLGLLLWLLAVPV